MLETKKKIISAVVIFLFSLGFSSFARAETLKIGFVTDWEYGSQKKYTHKFPSKAVAQITKVVNYFNSEFQPDLVVGGGDYILGANVKKKTAQRQLNRINQIFTGTKAPRLYCIGNHDLLKLTKEEVKRDLGIDYTHSVTDLGGVRIITLDTNSLVPGRKGYGAIGRMPQGELGWLEEQLDTNLPVIVFSHQSPIQSPEKGGMRTDIIASEEVRAVLEKNGNVVAVFSGHHAINYWRQVNGVNYVIINNLTDQKALGSFATIEVNLDGSRNVSLKISQFGRTPAEYNINKTIN